MKTLIFLFVLTFNSAFAAENVANSPTAESVAEPSLLSLERVEASYAANLKGSSIQYMDGNSNGKGTNLSLRHYQDLGFKITDQMKAAFGGQFRQYFRPKDPKNPKRSDFEWRDPYVGVAFRDIWRANTASVSGKARYYLPVTEYNMMNRVKEYDEGNGSAQVGVAFGQKYLDGLLSFYAPFEFNYRFNRDTHKVRQDYWIGLAPAISCRLTESTAARVEYYTGDLNHRTDGTWTKFNDKVLGQTAALGLDWFPVKKFLLSPQVKWGRESFRFNAAELSLYAKYAFL